MSESDHKTAVVPVQSTALTRVGAKSLVARGRTDLRIKEEAEEWLKRGVELRDQGSYEEAFACFTRSIELNPRQVGLLCCLADAYHMGNGVQQDDVKALALYRQAAEEGSVEGIVCVGWHYACGDGIPLDNAEAARWWRRAAGQGDAEAQFLLATSYENGLGVPKDYGKAVQWYRKAADQGNGESREAIDRILREIDGAQR